MPETPFFSIIIPTYNRADKLDIPIKSILNQQFKNWELIIIDDGSTDETNALIQTYSSHNIHYFYQQHQGRSTARNLGISKARGNYICFQDSDDEYLPNHLQTLYEAILKNDTYKVFRTGMLIYENGKLSKKSSTNAIKGRNTYPFEYFTTAAFHRNLLNNKSFPVKYFVNEDSYFFLKIGELEPIYILNTWTAIYHYNPGNSGGVGPHYVKNMMNNRACLDDILTWLHSDIRHFIIKKRCLTEILLLAGHFTYRPEKIPKAIIDNLAIFCRFPIAYSYLCIRIIYVKWGEWSGLYRTRDRF
jgi:glycosyltransferase involved in cell wall biosynthesis